MILCLLVKGRCKRQIWECSKQQRRGRGGQRRGRGGGRIGKQDIQGRRLGGRICSTMANPVRMQFIFILRRSIIVGCLSNLNSCFEAKQAGMSLIYHFIMKRFPFQEAFKSGSSVCPHRKFLCSNFPKKEISLRSEPSSCLWAELFEETLACEPCRHPCLLTAASMPGSAALPSHRRAENPPQPAFLLPPLPQRQPGVFRGDELLSFH